MANLFILPLFFYSRSRIWNWLGILGFSAISISWLLEGWSKTLWFGLSGPVLDGSVNKDYRLLLKMLYGRRISKNQSFRKYCGGALKPRRTCLCGRETPRWDPAYIKAPLGRLLPPGWRSSKISGRIVCSNCAPDRRKQGVTPDNRLILDFWIFKQ